LEEPGACIIHLLPWRWRPFGSGIQKLIGAGGGGIHRHADSVEIA
jgi:hypothetical protein